MASLMVSVTCFAICACRPPGCRCLQVSARACSPFLTKSSRASSVCRSHVLMRYTSVMRWGKLEPGVPRHSARSFASAAVMAAKNSVSWCLQATQ